MSLEEKIHRAAIVDIVAERWRQVRGEGWTAEHDDEHDPGELAAAGAAYAANASCVLHPLHGTPLDVDSDGRPIMIWPDWDGAWWKPTTPRRDLVKAAALILAEIERIDRSTALAAVKGGAA